MPGWEGSTRRGRLPANWLVLRRARLELDGYQCTEILWSGGRCPERATDVDHLQPMTDDHSLGALRSKCGPHHRVKSSREGGHAAGALRRKMAAARYRPKDPHPGLIQKGNR